jgi:hypothetical protein
VAEKISEVLWKAFVKKQKLEVELDDKELLKALGKLDRTDEGKPEPRIQALKDLAKEIPKQITALARLKKQLGDKPFGAIKDELYAILEEAESLQKALAAKDAKHAKESEDEEDEDSAPSALVNPKLLFKQLSMCRKDSERTMKFAFVDAKGNEQPAMLAMHPRMSARKLFTNLQAAAGVKTGAYGSAWVDGMSLMLQLDKPLSGLVKKVRAPVKSSGFRITKAVLWNADGTVFEQDELPEEPVTGSAAQAALSLPVEGGSGARTAPPQPSVTYEKMLADLQRGINKAASEGSADTHKYKKLLEFAAGKAAAKDFLGAVAALRQIEQLLNNPAAKAEPGVIEASAAFKARLVEMLPQLKEARALGLPHALDATAKATEAGMAAGKRNFERANALLDEAEELFSRAAASQLERSANEDGASEVGDDTPDTAAALSEYQRARALVIARLEKLGRAVNASPHPLAAKAYFEIRSVQSNLTAKPDTSQAAAELERYLETDDVVADVDGPNPFGIDVALQETLMDPVYALVAALS